MDLEPGTLVTPTVRLVRPLDRGGMGTVWVADHLALDTQVAVKFIADRDEEGRRRAIERFRREASLAAKLKSPHAVRVYDHGFIDGATPFIVMELLDGHSLRAEIASRVLGLEEVSLIVSQVADVLTEAHALGIVHRDIKPENLFLIRSSYDIFVKVLDFGIAKDMRPDPTHDREPLRADAAHDATRTGALLGTPRYASPELFECAKDATSHADLWSLAVVAYEALVGQAPFSGDTLGALSVAISKAKFDAPSAKNDALSQRVDAWFGRALAPLPEERYPTAQALAEAFVALVGEGDERAAPLAHTMPDVSAASRGWWPPVVAVAALLAAGAGSWAYLQRSQPAPPGPASPRATVSRLPPIASSSPVTPAHDPPAPAASEASAASASRRPGLPPAPRRITPRVAPSGAGSCLAYDAASKRWIYTCATE